MFVEARSAMLEVEKKGRPVGGGGQGVGGVALWLIAEIISHVVQKELKEELFNLDIKNIICPLEGGHRSGCSWQEIHKN